VTITEDATWRFEDIQFEHKYKVALELIEMYQTEIRNNSDIKQGFCEGTLFKDRLEILGLTEGDKS
jgi:hypothetical protein